MLCRDVSDLRSKERELVTKDATIREIHHRVKNNLQTVAALLRMQARRIDSAEAQIALNDAMSRVAAIAIVHETLSQAFDEVVDFDRVADGLLRMVADVAATGTGVTAVRVGSFGEVSADLATSLSMVVTELCQNAVEHGLADRSGEVRVVPTVIDGWLRVEITDDGVGTAGRLRLAVVSQPGSVDREHSRRGVGGRFRAGRQSGGLGNTGNPGDSSGRLSPPLSVGRSIDRLHRRQGNRKRGTPGQARRSKVNAECRCPIRARRSGRTDPRASGATLERSALVLAQTAPDSVVLTGLERPLQAGVADVATSAHLLGLLDLEQSRTCVPDGEEQLRIFVQAGGLVAPIHGVITP